jgi:hypothetical protein
MKKAAAGLPAAAFAINHRVEENSSLAGLAVTYSSKS